MDIDKEERDQRVFRACAERIHFQIFSRFYSPLQLNMFLSSFSLLEVIRREENQI